MPEKIINAKAKNSLFLTSNNQAFIEHKDININIPIKISLLE